MQQRRPAEPHDEIDDRAAIDDLGRQRVARNRERDDDARADAAGSRRSAG